MIFWRNWYRLLLSVCCVLFPLSAFAMGVGQDVPSFSAKTLDGNVFDLVKARGQVVIVNFWAAWCEPCREEMPAMESYYKQHKNEGLQIIAVSMDDPADDHVVREVMKKYSYPAAFNRDVNYKTFGRIWRMPMTFVIDRHGILRKDGSVGEPKINLPLLDKLVTPLLQEH